MIDIHSHILPGIDDGAPDMYTSIKMAEIALAEGITKMIATPHFIETDKEVDKTLILAKTAELNQVLKQKGIPLEIFPGQEIFLSPGIPDLYRQGKILSLCDGGKYLLIELPMMSIPYYTEEVIYGLSLQGIKTIIAHPERNREITLNPRKIEKFVELGALLQINSLSLYGVFGNKTKHTAEKILHSGMVNFIATDCHTARSRSPRVQKIAQLLSPHISDVLLRANPQKVIDGKDINTKPINQKHKKMAFMEKLSVFIDGFKKTKPSYEK